MNATSNITGSQKVGQNGRGKNGPDLLLGKKQRLRFHDFSGWGERILSG